MNDDLNEFLCECFNVATHYCQTHDQYLCPDELAGHPCPVKPLGGKAEESALGDLTSFNLNTQTIALSAESIADFLGSARKSVDASFDSIQTVLLRQKKESEKPGRPHVSNKRDPLAQEIRVAVSFVALLDTMVGDFAKHVQKNEQSLAAAADNKSVHANFITRALAQAAKEINAVDSFAIESMPIEASQSVNMEYTVSRFEPPEITNTLDNLESTEEWIQTIEFNPNMAMPKKQDDGGLDEFRPEDFVMDIEEMQPAKDGQIRERFDECRARLSRVLDQALFDINCPNFFERAYVDSVNSYMDEFRQTIDALLRELKNSFNKL